MAYAPITGTGTGVAPVVNLTWPFISQSDVLARVNGVAATFTWTGQSQITFSSAVPSGQPWEVYRQTSVNAADAVFTDSSVLKSADLNLNQNQDLYAAQESAYLISVTGQLMAGTILGNNLTISHAPIGLTGAQVAALLPNVTNTAAGLVPASPGDPTKVLLGTGVWGAGVPGPVGPAGDVAKVPDRATMAAIAGPSAGLTRWLVEAGQEGMFVFSTSNLSSQVAADPTQLNYVTPSSDTTGASGAWVRKQDSQILASGGANIVGFLQSGTGAVARTVQGKLRESPSVKDYNAVGDGVTSDVTAFQTTNAAQSSVIVTAGTYNLPTTPTLTQPLDLRYGASLTGAGAAAIGYVTSAIRQTIQTASAPDQFAFRYYRRNANHSGGTAAYTSAGLRVDTYVSAGNTNYEWAGLFMVDNSATAGQNVGLYAQGHKRSTGPTWGSTSEVIDHTLNPTTGAVGHEVDVSADGTDNNNARVGIDVVVRKSPGAASNAVAGWGHRINNDGLSSFNVGYGAASGTKVIVGFDASQMTAVIGAYKMAVNQPILFSADNSRKMYHNGSGFYFANGGTITNALLDNGGLVVGSNQVIGGRIAGWGTSTGGSRGSIVASTATLAQVAAALAQLIEDLKLHGMLGV